MTRQIGIGRPLVAALAICWYAGGAAQGQTTEPINRHGLVTRHNVAIDKHDPFLPLTVGNGEFAFTMDVTGGQTFPEAHETTGILLGTQSYWGWHVFPNTGGYKPEDVLEPWESHGRQVLYPTKRDSPAGEWLRQNPHRIDLGEVGFVMLKRDGTTATLSDITNIDQQLDLWTGIVTSRFRVDGVPVKVQTCAHPTLDSLGFLIDSPLVALRRIHVRMRFAYPSGSFSGSGKDWTKPEAHSSELMEPNKNRFTVRRKLDMYRYSVAFTSQTSTTAEMVAPHEVLVSPAGAPDDFRLDFACLFAGASDPLTKLTYAEPIFAESMGHWETFWRSGGAIDLSGSSDPRADELERRIVLSQYLTAVQCAGSLPPQDTGLTQNSWFGKFYTEMHWAHGMHFALWNRFPLLERSLQWYHDALPRAEETARRQGYKGARWPSVSGPDGRESPSRFGPFKVGQQPHPIYFAELAYRHSPTTKTLQRWSKVVNRSAEFMASFLELDAASGKYVMGPPVLPQQELHDPAATRNPGFELAYWGWGLEQAQHWRTRLGQARETKWDEVLQKLAPLPEKDGLYLIAETAPDMYTSVCLQRDSPSHMGIHGLLPAPTHFDRETMHRSVQKTYEVWDWNQAWGWNLSLFAMAAARNGEPALAVEALLKDIPQNRCLANGHFVQDETLPLYLPGNGALLSAVAMMAAGWEGASGDEHAPGFPRQGWVVRWENLQKLP